MNTKRPVYTIDCETDPFKRHRVPVPFMWGCYCGERFRRFDDGEALVRWLAGQKCIVYAHNGGKFDYAFLWHLLEPGTELLIINGRVARFQIGDAEFRDSWNIFPMPLRAYRKDTIELWKLEPEHRATHDAEIERYNRTDCVALHELVTTFRTTYGSGLTLAGAALKYWSKTFSHDIPVSDLAFYETHKAWYCGGRVQCFTKGRVNRPFHVVDITSAYPYAMTFDHPMAVTSQERDARADEGDRLDGRSFYTVTGVSRGALPWRERMADEKTEDVTWGPMQFHSDNVARHYHVTGWELIAAIDTGRLTSFAIHTVTEFGVFHNFRDYVDHFFALKARAPKDSTDRLFAKLMLNSLYGKFGANPQEYQSYGIVRPEQIIATEANPGITLGRSHGPWSWAGTVGPHALMAGADPVTGEQNPVESDFYNVATAASITGFVRAYLLRHLDAVERVGGTVHYCDTDSIAYELPGEQAEHPFAFGGALGQWESEGRFDRGAIAGKKLYAFHLDAETLAQARAKNPEAREWKTASKGVKLNAEQICTVADGGEVQWDDDVPQVTPFRMVDEKTAAFFNEHGKLPARFLSRRVRMT